jgi:hypothetical protein
LAIGHHCKAESEASWTWFFEKVLKKYPSLDGTGVTLLMDRDKGGKEAAELVISLYFFY